MAKDRKSYSRMYFLKCFVLCVGELSSFGSDFTVLVGDGSIPPTQRLLCRSSSILWPEQPKLNLDLLKNPRTNIFF